MSFGGGGGGGVEILLYIRELLLFGVRNKFYMNFECALFMYLRNHYARSQCAASRDYQKIVELVTVKGTFFDVLAAGGGSDRI